MDSEATNSTTFSSIIPPSTYATATVASSSSSPPQPTSLSTQNPTTQKQPCLVPITTTSTTEQNLFYHQRKICGWKYGDIPEMFSQMRRGERTIYWICVPAERAVRVSMTGADVLDDYVGDGGSGSGGDVVMESNNDASGTELMREQWFEVPLLDGSRALHPSSSSSSSASRDSSSSNTSSSMSKKDKDNVITLNESSINSDKSRQATQTLLPIGHIALDYIDYSSVSTSLLGSGDGRIVSISTLFVLPTFRKSGVARWAMNELERLIVSGEVTGQNDISTTRNLKNCQQIGLSTLSNRHFTQEGPEGMGMWERTGLEGPGIRPGGVRVRYLGDWYRSFGYEFITEMREFTDRTPDGEEVFWWGEIWGKRVDGGIGLFGKDGVKG